MKKPWSREACRRRYVEGSEDITLRALSSLCGQPYQTLGRWSKQDNWVGQRSQFRDRLNTVSREKIIEKTSDKISDELAQVAIANYERHKLARDYAAKIIATKAKHLASLDPLPLEERLQAIAKYHSGTEADYWSKVLARSTAAIESVTGLKYYVDLNAAAGVLEKEGYEITNPSEES